MRLLFCMASNDISGGNKVFRHWMHLLAQDGHEIHCFTWDKRRVFEGWSDLQVTNVEKLEEVPSVEFDFVFFSNSFLVPMVLPYVGTAHPVLMAMAYESFHYGKTYAEAMLDKKPFLEILKLPISIMAVSRGVQDLLLERAGVVSYYVPHGIESHFYPRTTPPLSQSSKRILMVGSYLSPWKGMGAGFDAIEKLSKEIDVQLVLMTQPTINRGIFDQYSFPIEFHCRPDLSRVPEIYASCHVHLCCSWHEGTGMPTLECMKSGVPVIATVNDGVKEFAVDGENILLAERNNSDALYTKLKMLLNDQYLYDTLKRNGVTAMEPYTWQHCFGLFKQAQHEIAANASNRDKVDKSELDQLLQDLESDGLYTPLETYAALSEVNRELTALCNKFATESVDAENAVGEVTQLRAKIKAFVQNEKSESYASFRGLYDFCGMVLAIAEDKNFSKLAAKLAKQKISVATRSQTTPVTT